MQATETESLPPVSAEEAPYSLVTIEILANRTDQSGRQILQALRPGMTTAVNSIYQHFGRISLRSITHDACPACIGRGKVG